MSKYEKNEHISKYLDYYFGLEEPGYAVLLSGKWGCGKTWFIKEKMKDSSQTDKASRWRLDNACKAWSIKKKVKEENNTPASETDETSNNSNAHNTNEGPNKQAEISKKFLYISLYGIKDTSEIDMSIIQALFPFLSSKTAKIGSALGGIVIRTVMRSYLRIDSKELNNIKLSELISAGKNKTLIFDDLERCFIDFKVLFGYLNKFIEHEGIKIVILAHEGELFKINQSIKSNESQNNNNFNKEEEEKIRYKEKIIGQTFRITPCFEAPFDSFIKSIKSKEHNKLLQDNKEIIKNIYEKVGNNNLRNLRQGVICLPNLLEQFPKGLLECLKNEKVRGMGFLISSEQQHVIMMYFSILFQEKSGKLTRKIWEDKLEYKLKEEAAFGNFESLPERTEYQNRHLHYLTNDEGDLKNDGILNDKWYSAVVENSDVKEDLERHYNEMKKQKKEEHKPIWVLREDLWVERKQENFKENFKSILNSLKRNEIKNFKELFYVFDLLLHLSRNKIIFNKIEDVTKKIKDYVIKNIKDGILRFSNNHSITYYAFDDAISYFEGKTKEFKDMQTFYEEKRKETEIESKRIELTNKFNDPKLNFTFITDMFSSGTADYSMEFIFSCIQDKKLFFDKIISWDRFKIKGFVDTLEKRYSSLSEEKFLKEYFFIKEFYDFVKSKKNKLPSTPNPSILKYIFLEESLWEILKSIDDSKKRSGE